MGRHRSDTYATPSSGWASETTLVGTYLLCSFPPTDGTHLLPPLWSKVDDTETTEEDTIGMSVLQPVDVDVGGRSFEAEQNRNCRMIDADLGKVD